MAKTIPMIISNTSILVKDRDSDGFRSFEMNGIDGVPNIPFYHLFAGKIAECQHSFKEFIKGLYGKKFNKNIFAIIIPDDTSPLEQIFINEFFVNSGACKAVAQMPMSQALAKNHNKYISLSMSSRNITLEYIKNGEIKVKRFYDCNHYDVKTISEDAKRLHIDIEYSGVPVFINNFNMNMDEFFDMGTVISPKDFMDKISDIDVEKV